MEGSSLETIRQMVASGIGVAVLPGTSVPERTRRDALIVYLPFRRPVPRRRVVLVWRKSFTRTRRSRRWPPRYTAARCPARSSSNRPCARNSAGAAAIMQLHRPDAVPGDGAARAPGSGPAAAPHDRPARMAAFVRLTRLDKPIGILLLLWPTLGALWIAAGGWPGWRLLLVFCLGTVLMRSAGCAINDVADRHFDAHVQRTAARPLARGELSVREAVLAALALAALAGLSLPLLDPAATPLALVALAVAASYPYFKRFFPLPQAWLGIAFSFGIPMAFAAVQGAVPLHGWLLLLANLFWVIAYDTEYAMVDRPDDLRIGVRSSAIFFGRADVFAVAVCYGLYLGSMAGIGRSIGLDAHFAAGWCIALACAMLHTWWIRGRDPAQCFRAFVHNHWLGLAIFGGIAVDLAQH